MGGISIVYSDVVWVDDVWVYGMWAMVAMAEILMHGVAHNKSDAKHVQRSDY